MSVGEGAGGKMSHLVTGHQVARAGHDLRENEERECWKQSQEDCALVLACYYLTLA